MQGLPPGVLHWEEMANATIPAGSLIGWELPEVTEILALKRKQIMQKTVS